MSPKQHAKRKKIYAKEKLQILTKWTQRIWDEQFWHQMTVEDKCFGYQTCFGEGEQRQFLQGSNHKIDKDIHLNTAVSQGLKIGHYAREWEGKDIKI